MSIAPTQPPLRVAGRAPTRTGQSEQARSGSALRASRPALAATDPRWVLAVRTREQLQGAILRPDRRQRLIRLGRTLGLGPFESNLVIAIVQDQARRGGTLVDAAPALGLVAVRPRPKIAWRPLVVGGAAMGVIALEAMAMWLWW